MVQDAFALLIPRSDIYHFLLYSIVYNCITWPLLLQRRQGNSLALCPGENLKSCGQHLQSPPQCKCGLRDHQDQLYSFLHLLSQCCFIHTL